MKRLVTCFLSAVLVVGIAQAEELRIGRYFSDGMILQRDKPNVIRGTAAAGAEVKVSFAPSAGSGQAGQEKAGKADETGQWAVTLDPAPANAKGAELAVTAGKDKAVVKNVLVGDVILFARQTSIDITLGRDEAGKKVAAAHKKAPGYRAIVIRTVQAPRPQADLDEKATTGWQEVDRTQALTMTAAAYYLGRDLADASDVPIGIVDLNMGWNFPIGWLSKETLASLGTVDRHVERYTSMQEAYEKGEEFIKQHGKYRGTPVEHPFYPAAGYNASLHPLRGVGIKGVLLQLGNNYPYMFYEELRKTGENTDREALDYVYRVTYDIRKEGFRMEPWTMPYVTGEWRKVFGDETLPIAFVQPPSSELWTFAIHNQEMREIQRKIAAQEEATDLVLPGMDNVPFSGQPRDEALLAQRSLTWVASILDANQGTPASGPLYARHEADGSQATVSFKEGTAKGLRAAAGALDHFEVADVDAEYVPASAVIDGDTIRLSSDKLSRIFYIRYNWTDGEKPDDGLVNAVGLPAIPFRTEEAGHRWLPRYQDDDLPEEYSTPANEWKNGSVTLVNGQLMRIGYTHFSGWLGPVGALTGPFGPNMGVREVKKGSPADGKLLVGDMIYSANGKMLGEEEEMVMSAAITESEATDGKLTLGVHRDGKNLEIPIQLEVLGRYSATSPWNCLKTEKIVSNLEQYVAARGAGNGFLFTDAMFMLAAGSPEYQWWVRKTAGAQFEGPSVLGDNWSLGYLTIYLSEYYLSTGDKRVLPRIKKLCEGIAEMQIREDGNRNGGWYGRGNSPRTYPAMVHAGISAMLALTLAKECGVEVDPETYQRGLAYLERKGAPVGQIIYGDAYRTVPAIIDPERMLAGKLDTSNGKVAEAAILYNLIGDQRAAYINSQISIHSWYSTRAGHGGNFWNDLWTPLGAAVHSKESYIYFMKNHRWYREFHRMSDGSLLGQDRRGAGTGLALVVPRQRMRILGAAKSPFSPDAPAVLKEALAAYEARDYKQAETLAQAILANISLDKAAAPTVSKLVEEARRMQAGIDSDLATIGNLIHVGRLHEAGLMLASLKPVIAERDPRLALVGEQLAAGTARANDQASYEAGLKAGGVEEVDESAAESADALKKLQERKAAAAARSAVVRTWECFTPKEFIVGSKKKMDFYEVPADKAAKWRLAVLETRDNAPEGWMKPGFDDSRWSETTQPISWHVNHIALLRTTFTVKDRNAYDRMKFQSWVFRQQDVEIHLNGVLIGRINNIEGKTGSIEIDFKKVALDALQDGENTLAIGTRQNWRWGMLRSRVYNDGFDFMLSGRLADGKDDDSVSSMVIGDAGN